MRLTVFDDLPTARTSSHLTSSHLSEWVSEGRQLVSRASSRASMPLRRKPTRPTISGPLELQGNEVTLRKQPSLRRLELSIYLPGNRLSPLPDFVDAFKEDDVGIPYPEPALLRTRSDTVLSNPQPPIFKIPRKPVSTMGYHSRNSSRLSSANHHGITELDPRSHPMNIQPPPIEQSSSINITARSEKRISSRPRPSTDSYSLKDQSTEQIDEVEKANVIHTIVEELNASPVPLQPASLRPALPHASRSPSPAVKEATSVLLSDMGYSRGPIGSTVSQQSNKNRITEWLSHSTKSLPEVPKTPPPNGSKPWPSPPKTSHTRFSSLSTSVSTDWQRDDVSSFTTTTFSTPQKGINVVLEHSPTSVGIAL
ncbi:MAG: hypothetical protein M1834_009207 [Cirrosporium novae-zelandiae]|nr:MAG: hypothetical protein M1834_009207 [Cirrosporium novae-zelandiae]